VLKLFLSEVSVLCLAVQIQDWYWCCDCSPVALLLIDPYALNHDVLYNVPQLVVFRGALDGVFVCFSTKQILIWIFELGIFAGLA